MREIRIVITDTSVSFPDGQELGRVGEHNATQLLIELPAEMVEGIDYHIIKFSLLGGAITSDIITEDDSKQIYISDGKIYCTLWQQLTASRGMSFTIEAYKIVGGTPTMIKKSPLVSGLRFDLSADAGAEVDEQGYSLAVHVNTLDERVTAAEGDISALAEDSHNHTNKSLLDTYTQTETALADAVSKKHEHDNKSTLDGFSSVEGILPTYNGAILPQMAVDTDYDNGTIATYNSIGVLTSAENSEGQPLKASDVVGTIDKAHEHDNMFVIDKFTEDDNGRPLYDGEPIGGEITQATETALGGIKAKAKTTETNEVAIDPVTGKLFANAASADVSDKADKVTAATDGNLAGLNSSGNLTDSGIKLRTVESTHEGYPNNLVYQYSANLHAYEDISLACRQRHCHGDNMEPFRLDVDDYGLIYTASGAPEQPGYQPGFKTANRAPNPTAGNLAGLDAQGNLTDSGKKPADFVAAVAGKGLSTEDYTTDEKNKLSGIAAGAEVNVINGVSYNGNNTLAFVRSKTLYIDTDWIYDVTGENYDGELFLSTYADMVLSLTLDDDVVIELPTTQEMVTGYSHMIYMQLTCSADVNISFAAGVDVDSNIDTSEGYHELIMTYHTDGDVWRVRQVAEDFA